MKTADNVNAIRTAGRSMTEKIALFRRSFSGRMDVYGTYDPETGRS